MAKEDGAGFEGWKWDGWRWRCCSFHSIVSF